VRGSPAQLGDDDRACLVLEVLHMAQDVWMGHHGHECTLHSVLGCCLPAHRQCQLRRGTAVPGQRGNRSGFRDHPLGACATARTKDRVRPSAFSALATLASELKWRASVRTLHTAAMKKQRIVTLAISGGRLFTRPFRDARRFPSTRWYPVPRATRTTLGFGICPSFKDLFRSPRAKPKLT
jgi:hypothetical protein